jgi:prepilin-type N-terminal cleavage/methylation domain-containing protein
LRRTADITQTLRGADGFTLIELMIAILILAVGILSTFGVFDSSNHAISVSELQQVEIHRAQREIERLQSRPYKYLFLNAKPATSSNKNNPGFYVSAPAGSCPTSQGGTVPTFQWNQTEASTPEQLVIAGCEYKYELKPGVEEQKPLQEPEEGIKPEEGVTPEKTWTGEHGTSGTLYDYITWVTDPKCGSETGGCPKVNDYKRITVEVTNNTSRASIAPTAPVLVTAIVVNPRALPKVGAPKEGNPIESTEIKCKNATGQEVNCSEGLGSQTANVWYLTDSSAEQGYTAPGDNACMHYTSAWEPLVCGVSETQTKLEERCSLTKELYSSCPQLDLLRVGAPAGETAFNFSSPPLAFSAAGPKLGRTLVRDEKAVKGSEPCSAPPSQNAETSEWWATEPLSKELKLTGNGGMTLNTATWSGELKRVTLCVGIYLEYPVYKGTGCTPVHGPHGKPILDPLNVLVDTSCKIVAERPVASERNSQKLGVGTVSKPLWPAEVTPVSFTFREIVKRGQVIPEKASIAVRIWPTAKFEAHPEEDYSEDDVVLQYDFTPPVSLAPSLLQINSE